MNIEGKTKRIEPGPKPHTVYLRTKDELTAGDAASRATFEGIAAHKTAQTANVFGLLAARGIPTAFIEQTDETSLLCHACDMLPLELVIRRYAYGSYLKREPKFDTKGEAPHRFDEPLCEIYHKWAVVMPPLVEAPVQMEEGAARERFLKDGKWAGGVYTDPYVHPVAAGWDLHPAKVPFSAEGKLMTIAPVCTPEETRALETEIMRPCFEALEEAWQGVVTEHGPVALADMKIEVGRRTSDGALVIADVIDNDSWRIWPGGNPALRLDKQMFRDGDVSAQVPDTYALVARLTGQFAA